MAKTNSNGTASAGATAQILAEDNARTKIYFKNNSATDVMTLNFGASATASNIFKVAAGDSVYFDKKSPFPIEKTLNVFCASAHAYECQSES